MRKKHKISSSIFLPLLLVLLLASLLSNCLFIYQNIEKYRIVRVPDGDSLDLTDGRRIRLLGIDAPEKGRCLSQAAKERLEMLASGKKVRLADETRDNYGRILANVFVGNILINKAMVEEGLAKFVYVTSPHYQEMKEAAKRAKERQLGIYSEVCKSTTPTNDCLIKGNLHEGNKIYFLPYCQRYDDVIIDEAFGDRWFCSEEEAIKAGFRKPTGC